MSMSSNLNNAAKAKKGKKVVFRGGYYTMNLEKEIEIPPVHSAEYPVSLSERALREYIANNNVELVNVPVKDGRDERNTDKVEEKDAK